MEADGRASSAPGGVPAVAAAAADVPRGSGQLPGVSVGCECLLTTYVWAPPANRVPPPGFIPVKIYLLPVSLESRDNFFTISRIAVFYRARNRVTVIPRSESK